ncbi:RNA polymerase sigma factor sigma-70 region 4 domain-containing protein [Solilutibacter oculi]|uniref:hypothetical protein n=1 Tax=Solilutibacter oculi TaxID=2698682 RepID=UPI0013A6152B|nr:hypothetical protein [Lysobacter oculi]
MPATPADASSHPAFRRLQEALERPAAVFAELCSGDAVSGDRAVAGAMRGQGGDAGLGEHALRVRFWRALLDAPALAAGPLPALPAPLNRLSRLPAGLRALVLLKALSGLGDVELGAMLGRTPAACRQALARAEALAGPDDWQAWSEALAAKARQLPAARLVNIASARSQPVAGPQWGGRDAPEAPRASPWRRRGLIAVAGVTALALAATFWWMPGGEPKIRSRPLADAAVASRFDADTAIASHPDRVLLSMSEADAAVARDTAFYAWYQAERLGTSEYEPPPPTFEAPESSASSADTGGQGAP